MDSEQVEEEIEALAASLTGEYSRRTPPDEEPLTIQIDHHEGRIVLSHDEEPVELRIASLEPYVVVVEAGEERGEYIKNDEAAVIALDHYLGLDEDR